MLLLISSAMQKYETRLFMISFRGLAVRLSAALRPQCETRSVSFL